MGKRGPKYPHTRELVNIALDDGMTQTEIKQICRTQQSIVSSWANGKSKAFTHQLQSLIEKYGHRLRRAKGAIYITHRPPVTAWEDSPQAATLAPLRALVAERDALQQQIDAHIAEYRATLPDEDQLPSMWALARLLTRRTDLWGQRYEQLVEERDAKIKHLSSALAPYGEHSGAASEPLARVEAALREDHAHGAKTWALVRIMGPVVWRHVFEEPSKTARRTPQGGIEHVLRWRPRARWMVHEQSDGQLVLVRQAPRVLVGTAQLRWQQAARQILQTTDDANDRVYSREDDGRWQATVEGPMTCAALLARTDELLEDADPHAQATVPLLLRKRLAERGYDVPGIFSVTTLSPSQE